MAKPAGASSPSGPTTAAGSTTTCSRLGPASPASPPRAEHGSCWSPAGGSWSNTVPTSPPTSGRRPTRCSNRGSRRRRASVTSGPARRDPWPSRSSGRAGRPTGCCWPAAAATASCSSAPLPARRAAASASTGPSRAGRRTGNRSTSCATRAIRARATRARCRCGGSRSTARGRPTWPTSRGRPRSTSSTTSPAAARSRGRRSSPAARSCGWRTCRRSADHDVAPDRDRRSARLAPSSRSSTAARLRQAPGADTLLATLNPAQREAVSTTEGPLLVLAGAGTGKTRVITTRIAYLIANGAAPASILAVTFTNKAAGEMRERVAALVGERAREVTLGTFHAFCVKVLREHGRRLGLPRRFTICDAADQLSAVKSALRELRVHETTIHPSAALARISLGKNRLESAEALLANAEGGRDQLVGSVWQRYREHLGRTRTLDFDDLLLETLRLLNEHADVLRRYRERYRHVLVDECQDTNGPQYEIVRAIAGEHRNVCVVGDDDQSIYGWRGADIRKILGFPRDFEGARVVKLVTNSRTTSEILDAANALIGKNPSRHDKELVAARGGGRPVRYARLKDETQEAQFVVEALRGLLTSGQARASECAILCRTQVQFRPFEGELRAQGVPYSVVGGLSFFDRKEVRDIVAYLRLAANPHDETSLLRVVNTPSRGVGKASLDRVLAFATEQGISASEAFARSAEIADLSPA